MTRRAVLQGVANNLASSFVSRNNDIGGYWGLGMLYIYCQENSQRKVTFALAPPGSLVEIEPLAAIVVTYATALKRLMHKNGVPERWLSAASVEIEFDVKERPYPLCADPSFLCQVQLTTDNGRIYRGLAAGYCRPHDPNREFKSTRTTS